MSGKWSRMLTISDDAHSKVRGFFGFFFCSTLLIGAIQVPATVFEPETLVVTFPATLFEPEPPWSPSSSLAARERYEFSLSWLEERDFEATPFRWSNTRTHRGQNSSPVISSFIRVTIWWKQTLVSKEDILQVRKENGKWELKIKSSLLFGSQKWQARQTSHLIDIFNSRIPQEKSFLAQYAKKLCEVSSVKKLLSCAIALFGLRTPKTGLQALRSKNWLTP